MPNPRNDSTAAKKLAQLRRQVYGLTPIESGSISKPVHQSVADFQISETSFLRRDLTKITILSSLALGIQFLLYIMIKNNIVKF